MTFKRNVKKIKTVGTACFKKQKAALAKAATTHAATQAKLDDLYQKQKERTLNVQRQYDTAVALQSKEHAKAKNAHLAYLSYKAAVAKYEADVARYKN